MGRLTPSPCTPLPLLRFFFFFLLGEGGLQGLIFHSLVAVDAVAGERLREEGMRVVLSCWIRRRGEEEGRLLAVVVGR